MTAPVDVLAVLTDCMGDCSVQPDHDVIAEARAALAELISERDRLDNIVHDHEAQILRMTELAEAAEDFRRLIVLTPSGPFDWNTVVGPSQRLKDALARCKGGAK